MKVKFTSRSTHRKLMNIVSTSSCTVTTVNKDYKNKNVINEIRVSSRSCFNTLKCTFSPLALVLVKDRDVNTSNRYAS